ncbi:hypothetical protein Lal_00046677 [Lupinus albus]|nr:hypothetical protein Lal_00046677 [Lupinus albus]
MVACKEKSSRNMSHTDFPIFWNYKMLAGWKNHEIISARRKIVKLCGALCPISISTCAKNQVKIRPVASEKPSMSPQKKGCPVLDRGFLHISLLLGGAACLPTHLGGSGWRAMGLPPSAPASFPKNAGAFFHGHVGNSTESKIVHAESSSGELPACPRTLVGQDGVPWGSLPAPQQAFPSMLLRSSLGRAEASSVTRSARKVVALGEAFTGISLARRGQVPNHPEVHYGRFIMVEAKARPCLTRSATSLQSPRPSEKCALLRCRPGLTVPRWVVWHIRSTEGQVPKHPEVHSGRFNAVEAKARPWLKQSATSLQSPRPSEKCSLLRCRPGLTVRRWVVWHIRSTEGQVPKHPEVHSGRFSTVEAEARPRLKQSATSLQSPRPSEMCALLRCRPGLTVSRWVVVGIPRTCRGFSCGPFCTEGCGARCCLNGHSRSTKGQVSKHPEVHFWRLNMVEAMAR